MKKNSLIAIIILILSGTALSAKDFDWSECWCNYGGGIEKGDIIINLDGGLYYSDFDYARNEGYWFIPPLMFEIQFAQPIWKLPFTFGGYAGTRIYGFNNHSYWGIFFGGEAAYHIMLPPEKLDVYAVTRIGGNIPFVKPGVYWDPEYFHIGEAIGAYWYFGKNFGLNLEIGYPFSKFGVSFKF